MGERSSSACKRARQESVHLLSNPSGFRPMPGAGELARPKRKPPGGVSRGSKLARTSEGGPRRGGCLLLCYACAYVVSSALAFALWEWLIGPSQPVCVFCWLE